MKNILLAALYLTIGNFIFQAMFDHEWIVAAERSFFQASALLMYWLAIKYEVLK